MKRTFLIFTALLMGLAASSQAQSKEDARLEKSVSVINDDASIPEGEKVVIKRIENQFTVDDATINNLRSQNLGFGEIAIVLALAEKQPGGITAANIDNIMSMRKGPPVMGWGKIAKKLGFKLGPIISNVEKVKSGAHREIEKGSRENGTNEKHERPARHEKPERPEKPEKP